MSHVIKGENDIKTKNPNLAEEWHPQKNGDVTPDMVAIGSNKDYYWFGKCGHEWLASPKNRNKGRGCPYCSNQKLLKGFNDLETRFPELMKEWDYKKNTVKPSEIIGGRGENYYWICSKGHTYPATISHKKRGDKCPFCGNKKLLVGFNDLATLHPNLAEEWNFSKNTKKPQDYLAGSNDYAFWKCKFNHTWSAMINSRTQGSGCPYCSGQRVWAGFNDLASKNPELASEWDYTKNTVKPTEVTVSSGNSFWWICQFGHSWKASITNRNQGKGCPECDKRNKTSFPEQAIFYYIKKQYPDAQNRYKEIFDKGMELDIYIPSIGVGIEYDGPYHKNKKSIERDERKYSLCKKQGIKLVRISNNEKPKSTKICDIFIPSDYNFNNFDAIDSFMKILQKTIPIDISIDTNRDVYLIKKVYLENRIEDSFGNKYPDIAMEWDYESNNGLTPYMFSPGATDKVWWKCSLGHKWKTSIECRSRGHNCVYCTGQKVLKGFNDLETNNPELLKDWDYMKNNNIILPSQVTSHSTKKVMWVCHYGHESYSARIADKIRGRGCPLCKKQKVGKNFSKPVSRYDLSGKLIKSYNSVKEASDDVGKSVSAIAKVCRGENKTCANCIWKYN